MSTTPHTPENRKPTTPAAPRSPEEGTDAPLTFGGGTDAIPAMFTVKERQWRRQQG